MFCCEEYITSVDSVLCYALHTEFIYERLVQIDRLLLLFARDQNFYLLTYKQNLENIPLTQSYLLFWNGSNHDIVSLFLNLPNISSGFGRSTSCYCALGMHRNNACLDTSYFSFSDKIFNNHSYLFHYLFHLHLAVNPQQVS